LEIQESLDIQYLAMEGGGGWGAAYIGAMRALAERDIINHFEFKSKSGKTLKIINPQKTKGIAGVSVGALGATLIAAGLEEEFFVDTFTSDIPLSFYDSADTYTCPVIHIRNDGSVIEPISYCKNVKEKTLRFADLAVSSAAASTSKFIWQLTRPYVKNYLRLSIPDIFQKILKKSAYIISMFWDLGFFTGKTIRDWLDDCLTKQTGIKNITFEQFHELTSEINGKGFHLKIGGVCLNTGEMVWFDHKGPWKKMCIADAVRISISIPGIFKPVAITTKPHEDEVNLETMLLFVDGGVLNNNPIHAFDNLKRKRIVPKVETLIFGTLYNPATDITRLNKKLLGLRLTDPSSTKVQRFDNGLSMFGWIIELMVSQNEMSQIRTLKEAEQTIDLDTRGLDILEFKVDREKLEMINDKIYEHTIEWLDRNGSIYMKKSK